MACVTITKTPNLLVFRVITSLVCPDNICCQTNELDGLDCPITMKSDVLSDEVDWNHQKPSSLARVLRGVFRQAASKRRRRLQRHLRASVEACEVRTLLSASSPAILEIGGAAVTGELDGQSLQIPVELHETGSVQFSAAVPDGKYVSISLLDSARWPLSASGGTIMVAGNGTVSLSAALRSGQYFLQIEPHPAETEAMEFSLQAVTDPPVVEFPFEDQHSNAADVTATVLNVDSGTGLADVVSSFETRNDIDVFQIVIPEAQQLVVFGEANGHVPIVELLSADGAIIDSNIVGAETPVNFALSHELNAGTYYIRLTSNSFSDTSDRGEYRLLVGDPADDQFNEPGPATTTIYFDPNDLATVTGTHERPFDRDVFQFTVHRSAALSFEVLYADGGSANDISAWIQNSAGQRIAQNLNNSPTPSGAAVVSLNAGTYYLTVAPFYAGDFPETHGNRHASRLHEYRVAMSLGSPDIVRPPSGGDDHSDIIGPTATTVTPAPVNWSLNFAGDIYHQTDRDVFHAQITVPATYEFSYPSPSAFTFAILNASGHVLQESNGHQTFTFAAGSYFFRVSGNDLQQNGPYNIHGSRQSDSGGGDSGGGDSGGGGGDHSGPDEHVDFSGQHATLVREDSNGQLVFEGALQNSTGPVLDRDVFQFVLTGPRTLYFGFDAETSPVVSIHNSLGTIDVTADQPIGLSAGTHFLRVEPWPLFDVGSYHITAALPGSPYAGAPDADIDQLRRTAQTLSPGLYGSFSSDTTLSAGVRRVFRVQIDTPGQYRLGATDEHATNAEIRLYRGDGVPSGQISNAPVESMIATELVVGEYFLVLNNPNIRDGQFNATVSLLSPLSAWVPTDDHANAVGPFATQLIPDESGRLLLEGIIDETGDRDVFEFTTDGPVRVQFTQSGPGVPSYYLANHLGITLLDSLNLSHEDGVDLTIDGTWFILVNGDPGSRNTRYAIEVGISILEIDPPADDHPDTVGPDATLLDFNALWESTVEGRFETLNDRDVYAFTVHGRRELAYRARPNPLRQVPEVQLFDANQNLIGVWNQEEITQILNPGTYYVSLNATSAFGRGDYHFNLSLDDNWIFAGAEVELDPNGGFVLNGYLGGSDLDAFQLNLPEAQAFRFTFQSASSPESISIPSLNIDSILDDGGSVWSSNQSTFDVLLPAGPSRLWLSVSSQFFHAAYRFNATPIAYIDDHPDDPDSATPAAAGFALHGRNEAFSDVDVFRIVVSEQSDFYLKDIGTENVQLIGPEGIVVADSSSGADRIVQRLQPGTYFVSVSQAAGAGEYRVELTVLPVFIAPVSIASPDTTIDRTPQIEWAEIPDALEYEVFVGLPGDKEAVFRTRGLNGRAFEIPVPLPDGEYEVFVRGRLQDGRMSRWGRGNELRIGGTPAVSVTTDEIHWDPVNGASRYEVWIDRFDTDGNRVERQAAYADNVTGNSYVIPANVVGGRLGVWVQAVNDERASSDNSGWSRKQSVEVSDAPVAPVVDDWMMVEYHVQQFNETGIGRTGAMPPTYDGDLPEQVLRISAGPLPAIRYTSNSIRPFGGTVQQFSTHIHEFRIVDPRTGDIVFEERTTQDFFDLTISEISDTGTGRFQVETRTKSAIGPDRWSHWSDSFEMTLGPGGPEFISMDINTSVDANSDVLEWTALKDRASFDENDIEFPIFIPAVFPPPPFVGIPQIDYQDVTYNVEILNAETRSRIQFTTGISSPSFEIPDSLQPGHYIARVQGAYGTETVTPFSSDLSVFVQSPPVRVTSGLDSGVDQTPTIYWQQHASSDRFEVTVFDLDGELVYRSEDISGNRHRIAERLLPGDYRLFVQAHHAGGSTSRRGEGHLLKVSGRPVPQITGDVIRWNPVNGATHYQLWGDRLDDSGNRIERLAVFRQRIHGTAFQLPDLVEGNYRFWISALRNESGETYQSPWSRGLDFSTSAVEHYSLNAVAITQLQMSGVLDL